MEEQNRRRRRMVHLTGLFTTTQEIKLPENEDERVDIYQWVAACWVSPWADSAAPYVGRGTEWRRCPPRRRCWRAAPPAGRTLRRGESAECPRTPCRLSRGICTHNGIRVLSISHKMHYKFLLSTVELLVVLSLVAQVPSLLPPFLLKINALLLFE